MNLMDKFLRLRLRHLLIDKNGEFVGLLSVVDVMRSALQEKTRELEELHTVATWEVIRRVDATTVGGWR